MYNFANVRNKRVKIINIQRKSKLAPSVLIVNCIFALLPS